jgi:hypothetical protein
MTEESGFSADKSKASGRRSRCRDCDNRCGKAYYAAHREELLAEREAAREAAWQAQLKALEKEHRKKVAATKRLHAAQVRRQKEFLRSVGVRDLSPEEVSERARREPGSAFALLPV